MATTGDRIREIREAKGLTQDQLSELAGLSKGFLSDVEHNNKNLSSQGLLRIANALGASVDYLLRGETQEFSNNKEIVIPPYLSEAAEDLGLSYSETLELLNAQQSVIARRSKKSVKELSVKDWKNFHEAIKKVFG
ncbi:MAG: helix-turn-helix transcriptional regulator [Chloracidobacterium sp.]|nr:helix-turn-helix transcriptional regulator [Chloracidobacterium sp.]